MKAEQLKEHIDAIATVLMVPWFMRSPLQRFKHDVDAFAKALKRYHSFLADQQARTAAAHRSSEPLRDPSDDWVLKDVDGHPSVTVRPEYRELADFVAAQEPYKPVSLIDLQPTERFERRNWLQNVKLQVPVTLYSVQQGNYLGNLNFIWKLPMNKDERMESSTVRTVNSITRILPVHVTRQMVKDFFEPYRKRLGLKPAILRHMLCYLNPRLQITHEHQGDAVVDQRVAQFLLNAEDEELVADLRALNGRPRDERYNPFWEELHAYLEEMSTVDDRRQDQHMYMPFAISVRALVDTIADRLPENTPLPSVSLVRLQFWPSNAYANTAMKYTGRYQVKYAVQQRILRADHPDSHYCAYQFNLLKEFCVRFRTHTKLLSEDDKAVVPIGSPGMPIGATARRHNRSLSINRNPSRRYTSGSQRPSRTEPHSSGTAPRSSTGTASRSSSPEPCCSSGTASCSNSAALDSSTTPQGSSAAPRSVLLAADHDFHVAGLVPSVIFDIEIPENSRDSFYKGSPVVVVKDKVFDPSSALQHAAETVSYLREDSEDETSARHEILVLYTDGGPDHRTNFQSVKLALVGTFVVLDLDMLVAARTAPQHSYRNPAERVMSDLNLALQNVSLSRQKMTDAFETKVRNLSSLESIRRACKNTPGLRDALMASCRPALEAVADRFGQLKRNDQPFLVRHAPTDVDMAAVLEGLQVFEPTIEIKDVVSGVDMTKWPNLAAWMKQHCESGHYMFQVGLAFLLHSRGGSAAHELA